MKTICKLKVSGDRWFVKEFYRNFNNLFKRFDYGICFNTVEVRSESIDKNLIKRMQGVAKRLSNKYDDNSYVSIYVIGQK